VSKRAGKALAAFAALHGDLETIAAECGDRVAPLIEAVLDRTGYRRMLQDEGADEEEHGEDRLANVEELVTAARQLDDSFVRGSPDDDALGTFLETTALVADTDVWDANGQRVALMTLHAAKGLEFPVVYLVAMEDGILPHERSLDNPDQLEEERRLVFVGITRGQEEVHASSARIRDYRGSRRINAPSLFLTEMTGSETVVTGPEAPADGVTLPAFEPWGDTVARDGDDEFSQVADESEHRTSPRSHGDGLVLELDDDQPRGLSRKTTRRPPRFQAAAELADQLAGLTKPQPKLTAGQRVRHEEYGTGTLSRISGTGPRSVGTVIFDGPAGTRKFIIGHGAITPE
jgi:DNA helicase-2/ATP-dependent DNA helicase PcrA